jgi:kynurenine formamidase
MDGPRRSRALPRYDELPAIPSSGARHSWGVFGDNDELGTLNLLDDQTVLAAMSEVQSGERISLSLEMAALDPPLYGRNALQHTYSQTGRNIWDDRLDAVFPQAASQWDGLRHVRHREAGFYGGITADPPDMGDRLGVHHWAAQGIIGRGVLLDVGRHLRATSAGYDPFTETPVSATLLSEVADASGVTVRRGDILCLRFGWLSSYRALDQAGRRALAAQGTALRFAGLAADESMAAALWDWHVAAVACDNPAAEVSPGDPRVGSLHQRLIPTLGIAVAELLDFDQLSARCATDGRWTFLLISVPLNVAGAVGSPANAIAIR